MCSAVTYASQELLGMSPADISSATAKHRQFLTTRRSAQLSTSDRLHQLAKQKTAARTDFPGTIAALKRAQHAAEAEQAEQGHTLNQLSVETGSESETKLERQREHKRLELLNFLGSTYVEWARGDLEEEQPHDATEHYQLALVNFSAVLRAMCPAAADLILALTTAGDEREGPVSEGPTGPTPLDELEPHLSVAMYPTLLNVSLALASLSCYEWAGLLFVKAMCLRLQGLVTESKAEDKAAGRMLYFFEYAVGRGELRQSQLERDSRPAADRGGGSVRKKEKSKKSSQDIVEASRKEIAYYYKMTVVVWLTSILSSQTYIYIYILLLFTCVKLESGSVLYIYLPIC